MKPGDLIRCLPEYTESETPVVGMILGTNDLNLGTNDLKWHARTIKYDVLFPGGVFPMYDYEMQLLDPEPVQTGSARGRIFLQGDEKE